MLQISRRANYAIRAMLMVGELGPDEWIPVKDIAREMYVPEPFLHKIATDLMDAGLINTQSGPKGGLKLARGAHKINLYQILEVIEGPLSINICLLNPNACPRITICPTHGVWQRLQDSMQEQLRSVSLAELVKEAQVLRQSPRKTQVPSFLKRS